MRGERDVVVGVDFGVVRENLRNALT